MALWPLVGVELPRLRSFNVRVYHGIKKLVGILDLELPDLNLRD